MPNTWVHRTIDLIAFGLPYSDLHQEKDKAYKDLGHKHRSVNHEWYHQFGKSWTFEHPFPDLLMELTRRLRDEEGPERAEEFQAWTSHDYIDKIWDTLSGPERKYWEGLFAYWALRPGLLKSKAGVDVIKGKIRRVIDGRERWEDCPELKSEYRRLRKYVAEVIKNDKDLQDMLARYGA